MNLWWCSKSSVNFLKNYFALPWVESQLCLSACEVNSPSVLLPGGPFEVVGSELLPAYVSEILGSLSVQCSDGCEMLGGCGFITVCLIQRFCYELTGGVLWKMAEESVQSGCKLVSSLRIQATRFFHQTRPKDDYFSHFYIYIRSKQHNSKLKINGDEKSVLRNGWTVKSVVYLLFILSIPHLHHNSQCLEAASVHLKSVQVKQSSSCGCTIQ